ncbi:MAG: ABC transporter substrate-binding protein [Saprospiraceae bacterium]|nr:ABC transporter substrate-binding protein [Saprospiraceae bacterium]
MENKTITDRLLSASMLSIYVFIAFILTYVFPENMLSEGLKYGTNFVVDKTIDSTISTFPDGKKIAFTVEQIALLKKSLVLIIYAFITIILTLATYIFRHNIIDKKDKIYLKNIVKEMDQQFEKARNDSEIYIKKINEIKDHISSPTQEVEKIKVALFSQILAYAPLYIAKDMGYFRDEGLDVEFTSEGSDGNVTKALESHEWAFGVSDPVDVFTQRENTDSNIRILLPLLKKLDLMVFAKKELFKLDDEQELLFKDKEIVIGSYSQPSTTYASALRLKSDLHKLGLVNCRIEELDGNADEFKSPENLSTFLNKCDIVLLWNPASAWMLSKRPPPGSKAFGILLVDDKTSDSTYVEDLSHWHIGELNIDELQKYNLWHPLNSRKSGYKVMATGILVSEYVLKHRPELCKRFARAICRAFVRIEGADWENVEKISSNGIWPAVLKMMDKNSQSYAEESKALERLVNNQSQDSTGRSIFPFIESITRYKPEDYVMHLKHLEDIWHNDEEKKNELLNVVEGGSIDTYVKYFADINFGPLS